MNAPFRTSQLNHPWLTLLFLTAVAALSVGLMSLPVWGWIELRFSPVQRFYLPAYLNATTGALTGAGPAYVGWIEKRGPGKAWEIAQPEDLDPAPAPEGATPFQLSNAARSEGWNELGYSSGGTDKEEDIRDYLQSSFFGGHSLLFLILQPLELVFVGWLFWKYFDHWRKDLARERGSYWDPHYRPNTLDQDLRLFLKQLAGESREITIQVRRWATPKQGSPAQPMIFAAESATVSPSRTADTATPIGSQAKPNAGTPFPVKVAEGPPVQSPKPAAPATKPNQPPAPKPQPVKAQPKAQPTPRSPFGKPVAEDEPERKWDISQWID
ncbi:MAG: hypothetical protein ACRYFU_26060 [Janthinobacterium lividum]